VTTALLQVSGGRAPSVLLDALMAQAAGRAERESLAWPELFAALFARLSPCYRFRLQDGQVGAWWVGGWSS